MVQAFDFEQVGGDGGFLLVMAGGFPLDAARSQTFRPP
jgi:hypothetical protein